jgi:hypothetical protein
MVKRYVFASPYAPHCHSRRPHMSIYDISQIPLIMGTYSSELTKDNYVHESSRNALVSTER